MSGDQLDLDEDTRERWERTACVYCGMFHETATACPPVEPWGTAWDQ